MGSIGWIVIWVVPSSLIIFLIAVQLMPPGPALTLVALSWGLWAFVVNHYQAKHSPYITRLSNFAVVNGFKFRIGLVNEFRFVRGAKGVGLASSARREFKGVLANAQDAVYTAAEVTGMIRGQQEFTLYNVLNIGREGISTVLEVVLADDYPHVLLDAKANNALSLISNVAHLHDQMGQINLEGDFNQHFTLYSAADPTLTLQVVEPSAMAAMIDHSLLFDIEIVSDRMYLILPYVELDSSGMQRLFDAAQQLLNNLDRAPLK